MFVCLWSVGRGEGSEAVSAMGSGDEESRGEGVRARDERVRGEVRE